MQEVLYIKNLSKHFGGIKVADEINLSIHQNTITGIYGDNGVGKTTLFNLISGFEKPDAGQIYFRGQNITNKNVLQRAKSGMGRLFQTPRIFPEVTVFNNLLAASRHSTGHTPLNYLFNNKTIKEEEGINRKKAMEILEHFSLTPKSNLKAYELSVGERKLLSLGSLLMNETSFILLDELSSGLNNMMIERLSSILKSLTDIVGKSDPEKGLSILMIEHDIGFLRNICEEQYRMQNGKLILQS